MVRFTAVGLLSVVLAGLLSATPAHAQYSIGGSDGDEPNIMCKAYTAGSYTVWASGEAPNVRESSSRFRYWADKYGMETGLNIRTSCERFKGITPEYRRSFEPGGSYQGSSGDTYTLIQAPFLPKDWSTTPTPEENARKESEKKAEHTQAAKEPSAAESEPKSSAVEARAEDRTAAPKKSAAQAAADEAAARRAQREAEFQTKQAEYERQIADRELKVEEFNRLKAKMEQRQRDNLAAAQAATEEYKREREEYAEALRRHQADVDRYRSQIAASNGAPPPASGSARRFQVTGAIVDTRESAAAALMRDPRASLIHDVQCGEVKMFTPSKWTCWGFVSDTVEPQSGSAQ